MARKIKKRNELKRILIALEDKKSSRYYIEKLAKDKSISAKIIFAKHIGTDPKNVLKAIKKFDEDNPDIVYEKAWIVIDKDDYSKDNFNGTINTARQKNICVAYSNECYELWLLLHFKDVNKFMDRSQIKKELNEEFRKNFHMDYEKSQANVYEILIDKQESAIKRAKRMINRFKDINGELNPYEDNPSTKLHILVECLNNLEKCKENDFFHCND